MSVEVRDSGKISRLYSTLRCLGDKHNLLWKGSTSHQERQIQSGGWGPEPMTLVSFEPGIYASRAGIPEVIHETVLILNFLVSDLRAIPASRICCQH